jgi:hypothetical protein
MLVLIQACRHDSSTMAGLRGHEVSVTVRRDSMFHDGFNAMHGLSSAALKGRLRLQFINEHGEQEAGIDGGGLFKDFMEHLIKVRAVPFPAPALASVTVRIPQEAIAAGHRF